MATIMEVTGSALEQSSAWEMAKSHLVMMETVMEKFYTLLERQEGMYTGQ